MPRHPPKPAPKGTKWPGAGRAKGTPNKISVEVRVLCSELVNNPTYQHRLRRDFAARKVHPTIESMVWAYFIGKPRQDIALTGTLDVNARIEEERRYFASLDLRDLEQLAAESQGLVDRAMALAKVRAAAANGLTPQPVVVAADLPKVSEETLTKEVGSDNKRSVNESPIEDTGGGTPTEHDA